jgi:hypothetical protein
MENKKTNYCGSGRKQSNTWIKATINVDKIQDFIEEFKGTKFVRININLREQSDQFGKDVSISIDEFVPESQEEKKSQSQEMNSDDLPF